MTRPSRFAEASLLYDRPVRIGDRKSTDALQLHLERLGLSVGAVERDEDRYVHFRCGSVDVLLMAVGTPLPNDHFVGVLRPSVRLDDDADIAVRLGDHAAHLTLVVAATDSGASPPQAILDAHSVHLADHLASVDLPDLVYLSATDTLYSYDEFDWAARSLADTADIGDDEEAEGASPFAERGTGILNVSPRADHLRTPPDLTGAPAEWLASGLPTVPANDNEQGDDDVPLMAILAAPGNAAVVVMSTTMVVLVLPVGLAILTAHMLTGGNLVATARTVALSGIGMAGLAAAQVPFLA